MPGTAQGEGDMDMEGQEEEEGGEEDSEEEEDAGPSYEFRVEAAKVRFFWVSFSFFSSFSSGSLGF